MLGVVDVEICDRGRDRSRRRLWSRPRTTLNSYEANARVGHHLFRDRYLDCTRSVERLGFVPEHAARPNDLQRNGTVLERSRDVGLRLVAHCI